MYQRKDQGGKIEICKSGNYIDSILYLLYIIRFYKLPLTIQWYVCIPPVLILKNSTLSPHSEFRVSCGSQNIHKLFSYTTLTD